MEVQVESYAELLSGREFEEALRAEMAHSAPEWTLVSRPRFMVMRGIDPTLLVASISAAGTLAAGLGSLIMVLISLRDKAAARKMVLKTRDGASLELPMGASDEEVEESIKRMVELTRRLEQANEENLTLVLY